MQRHKSPNTAPHPPDNFVPRPEILEQITAILLVADQVQPVALTTALQGGGGFGKTTLAQYVCHMPEIEAAFPNGILWVTIGQNPQVIELLPEKFPGLGETPAFAYHNRIQAYRLFGQPVVADKSIQFVSIPDRQNQGLVVPDPAFHHRQHQRRFIREMIVNRGLRYRAGPDYHIDRRALEAVFEKQR